MNNKLITVLAICGVGLCSCTIKRTDPGFVGYTAQNVTRSYTKVGKACNYNFYIFQWGDATVENIAKENNITDIITVENTSSFYPFIAKQCVIVKGN